MWVFVERYCLIGRGWKQKKKIFWGQDAMRAQEEFENIKIMSFIAKTLQGFDKRN